MLTVGCAIGNYLKTRLVRAKKSEDIICDVSVRITRGIYNICTYRSRRLTDPRQSIVSIMALCYIISTIEIHIIVSVIESRVDRVFYTKIIFSKVARRRHGSGVFVGL